MQAFLRQGRAAELARVNRLIERLEKEKGPDWKEGMAEWARYRDFLKKFNRPAAADLAKLPAGSRRYQK